MQSARFTPFFKLSLKGPAGINKPLPIHNFSSKHKKEKFFQINELVKLLAHHNLVIKNFFNGKIASVTKYFLNNPKYINSNKRRAC